MKKIVVLLILACFGTLSRAQSEAGDLYLGLQGSYVTNYKNFTAGIRGGYHFSSMFELNLAFNTNPWIRYTEEDGSKFDAQMYVVDLNAHFYVINNKTWGMAPIAGLSYFYGKEERVTGHSNYFNGDSDSLVGFNLGWDIRYNLGENWRIDGFWKYAMFKDDNSHHVFGLGVGYSFNVF